MNKSENKSDNVPFFLITDNYAWLQRLNNLAKKSGLILKKQGPFFSCKKNFQLYERKKRF